MFAVFVPSIYIICNLLNSDIGQLAAIVQGSGGEEFELNVSLILYTYTESNGKLQKFSTTFQRSLSLIIISLALFVLELPTDQIILAGIICFSLIAIELAVLAKPSESSRALRRALEILRPRETQFINYLLIKSEMQRGVGAVTLFDQKMTQRNVLAFLLRFVIVLLIVRGGMERGVFEFFF